MLRRADDIHLNHRPFWLTGRGRVTITIGAKSFELPEKISRAEFRKKVRDSDSFPQAFVLREKARTYWLFERAWFWDNEDLTGEQVHALLVTKQQRRNAEIERARAVVAMPQPSSTPRRGSIPHDVRQVVWLRDGGQCQVCGANVELQFDHIIPVNLGGASTTENLQILCGPCNRRKGAGLS